MLYIKFEFFFLFHSFHTLVKSSWREFVPTMNEVHICLHQVLNPICRWRSLKLQYFYCREGEGKIGKSVKALLFRKNFIHFLLVFGLTSIKVQSQGLYILNWLVILDSSANILRTCTCITSSENAENHVKPSSMRTFKLDKKVQKSESVS